MTPSERAARMATLQAQFRLPASSNAETNEGGAGVRSTGAASAVPDLPCTCERLDVDLYDPRGCEYCNQRDDLPAVDAEPLAEGDVEF